MPPAKRDILQQLSFGHRIAEEEMKELRSYFVKTEQWRQLVAGEKDIVYGAKGSGKSALYSLLVQSSDVLFDRGILIVAGEKPSGTPAFKALAKDPPATESEFIAVWKLYFLTLVAKVLTEWGVETPDARRVYDALSETGLLEADGLQARLRSVRSYVRRFTKPEAVEAGVALDPGTGLPVGLTGKLILRSDRQGSEIDSLPIDDLLEAADSALLALDFEVWIVIDRLDVAFAEQRDLEQNALRALFKAYLDMQGLEKISLKVFLRSDIWRKITEKGFREASHITRHLTITWERQSLMNLVLRRALRNSCVVEYYKVDPEHVYGRVKEQERLFARMMPDQVDLGRNPTTFDWMLSRTQDGSAQTAPRELIHLLSSLRDSQLRRIELGHDPPEGELLFDRVSFKEALKEVSSVRLHQTLLAEYPDLKFYVDRLEGEKTQQTPPTLAGIWGTDSANARRIADQLVDVGFFEARGTKEEPSYWVPFLYRDALQMVQGEARGFLHFGRVVVDRAAEALVSSFPPGQEARVVARSSGEGFEESFVLFQDARYGGPLAVWLFAAEARSLVNLYGRPAIVGAGLKQDIATELDRMGYRIRLNDSPFRWYRHLDPNRAGYRTVIEVPNWPTETLDDVVRKLSARVLTALHRARMVSEKPVRTQER